MNKATKMMIVLGIVFLIFNFTFLDDILSFLTPHDFVQGRDKPIYQHKEYFGGESGPGYNYGPGESVVVDAWLNPERMYHMYTNQKHNYVKWRDLNGMWHTTHVFSVDDLRMFVYVIWIAFMIYIYKKIDHKEYKKQEIIKII